jgi:hypothetical protein
MGGPTGSSVAVQTIPAALVTLAKLGRGVRVEDALGLGVIAAAEGTVADGVDGVLLGPAHAARVAASRLTTSLE